MVFVQGRRGVLFLLACCYWLCNQNVHASWFNISLGYYNGVRPKFDQNGPYEESSTCTDLHDSSWKDECGVTCDDYKTTYGMCFSECLGSQSACCFCGGGSRTKNYIDSTQLCYDIPGFLDTNRRTCDWYAELPNVRCYSASTSIFPVSLACCACSGGTTGQPLCIDERYWTLQPNLVRDRHYTGCWKYATFDTSTTNVTQVCANDNALGHCYASCHECSQGVSDLRVCPFCSADLCLRQPFQFMQDVPSYVATFQNDIEAHCSLAGVASPGCECCVINVLTQEVTCPLTNRCQSAPYFGFCLPPNATSCDGLTFKEPSLLDCAPHASSECVDDPRYDGGLGNCAVYATYISRNIAEFCEFEGADEHCPVACGSCSSCTARCGEKFRHERFGFQYGCNCHQGCASDKTCCDDFFGQCMATAAFEIEVSDAWYSSTCSASGNSTVKYVPFLALGNLGGDSSNLCVAAECASDIKVCPDGTRVSRIPGLGCDYPSCPDTTDCEDTRFWSNWDTYTKNYLGCWAYYPGGPADLAANPSACDIDFAKEACPAACDQCVPSVTVCPFCDDYMCLFLDEYRHDYADNEDLILGVISSWCANYGGPGCECCVGDPSSTSYSCPLTSRCLDTHKVFGFCQSNTTTCDMLNVTRPSLAECVPESAEGVCVDDPRFDSGFGNCTLYSTKLTVNQNKFCETDGALSGCPVSCGTCNSCKGICGSFHGPSAQTWNQTHGTFKGCSCNAICVEQGNCCSDYESECLCVSGCVHGTCGADGVCRCDLGFQGPACDTKIEVCPYDLLLCPTGESVQRLPEKNCAFDTCPSTSCVDLPFVDANTGVTCATADIQTSEDGSPGINCYFLYGSDGTLATDQCCKCGGGNRDTTTADSCLPDYYFVNGTGCVKCEDEAGYLNFFSASGALGCWQYYAPNIGQGLCNVDKASDHCRIACGVCSREEQICPFCDAYLCEDTPLQAYWQDAYIGGAKRWLFQSYVEQWCEAKGLSTPGCECCTMEYSLTYARMLAVCPLEKRCDTAPYVGFCLPENVTSCANVTFVPPTLEQCVPAAREGYCVDDPRFSRGWGNCTQYATGGYGHDFCEKDQATDACPDACNTCTTCKGRCYGASSVCSCQPSCEFAEFSGGLPCCSDYRALCVCPGNCSGHGTCLNGKCSCNNGWELGPLSDCSQATCHDWTRFSGDDEGHVCSDYTNHMCSVAATLALSTKLFVQFGISAAEACCTCGGGYYGPQTGSCKGSCAAKSSDCWCDNECRLYNDCCEDFFENCPTESCIDDPNWYDIQLIFLRGFSGCWAYASNSGAKYKGVPMHQFCDVDGASEFCPVACGKCVAGKVFNTTSGAVYGPRRINPFCNEAISRTMPTNLEITRYDEHSLIPMQRVIEAYCSLELDALGVDTSLLALGSSVSGLQAVPGCECCLWAVDLTLDTKPKYLSCPYFLRCTTEPLMGWCKKAVGYNCSSTAIAPPTLSQCTGLPLSVLNSTCINDPRFNRGFGTCSTYFTVEQQLALNPSASASDLSSNYWACEVDGATDACPLACGSCKMCKTQSGTRCGEPDGASSNCTCDWGCSGTSCCRDYDTVCGQYTGCLGLPFALNSFPCVDARCFADSFEEASQECRVHTCEWCMNVTHWDDAGCKHIKDNCVKFAAEGYCVDHVNNGAAWHDNDGHECGYYSTHKALCSFTHQRVDGRASTDACCACAIGGDFCVNYEHFYDALGKTCQYYNATPAYAASHCNSSYVDPFTNTTARKACCACDPFKGAGGTAGLLIVRSPWSIGDPCTECSDIFKNTNPSPKCAISLGYPCLNDPTVRTFCSACLTDFQQFTASKNETSLMESSLGATNYWDYIGTTCSSQIKSWFLSKCFAGLA